jgi:hypothetical protein
MRTSSVRRAFVAALAVVVTASVATVTGVSAAEERPAHLVHSIYHGRTATDRPQSDKPLPPRGAYRPPAPQ